MIMIFSYIVYFAVSIFTVWIAWYFRRFTIVDYQQDKKLQKKRRLVIILTYLVMILQGLVIGGREVFFYPTNNPWIINSAYIFGLLCAFLLCRVEAPKPWKKKKRPFK